MDSSHKKGYFVNVFWKLSSTLQAMMLQNIRLVKGIWNIFYGKEFLVFQFLPKPVKIRF